MQLCLCCTSVDICSRKIYLKLQFSSGKTEKQMYTQFYQTYYVCLSSATWNYTLPVLMAGGDQFQTELQTDLDSVHTQHTAHGTDSRTSIHMSSCFTSSNTTAVFKDIKLLCQSDEMRSQKLLVKWHCKNHQLETLEFKRLPVAGEFFFFFFYTKSLEWLLLGQILKVQLSPSTV